MTTSDNEIPPTRGVQHDALAVFLGRWRAEGQSYGSPNQPDDDPKSAPEPWLSTCTGTWHSGEFFLIKDERVMIGANPFDTLSVMGVDPKTNRYFTRSFENHGFYRHYDVAIDGHVWTISGEKERARIVFSADGRTQTIIWEWHPKDRWLPLCDQVAHRED